MSCLIKTRFLILSDTHGLRFQADRMPNNPVDVAIHCGDLTGGSKLHEIRQVIELLKEIDAPLKIVIAGNHDFSLDDLAFKQKITEASRLAQEDLEGSIKAEYGDYGDARRLFDGPEGIVFLEEGSHQFTLDNGALLRVYASPYTPTTGNSSDWGFQYSGAHEFAINKGTDIVVTHGPPHGIMDMTTERERVGCPQLFAAVARAQPKLHCFGHVHSSWGARLVAWRPTISDKPSHFSDVDNEKSMMVESLARLKGSKFESAEAKEARQDAAERYRSQRCCQTSHCTGDDKPLSPAETLFVNAAVMGADDELSQFTWLVDIELEPCQGKTSDDVDPDDRFTATPDKEKTQKRKVEMSWPEEEDGRRKLPRRYAATSSKMRIEGEGREGGLDV
ncbi:Metallophos domain-containing protein [Fusarium sp. LHS14.1]|nr:Metallophos domain-containing protein [Fusarium sp. LHS14.1]